MAEFAVKTHQLKNCANRISNLQRDLDSVAARLAGLQISSAIQSRASIGLMARVGDCKWAAIHQSNDLGRLAGGLGDVAELYEKYERNLTEPKTQDHSGTGGTWAEGVEESGGSSWWDSILGGLSVFGSGVWDTLGGAAGPFGVLNALFDFGMGKPAEGLKDLTEGASNILFGVQHALTNGADSFANWASSLLGFNQSGINGWGDALDDWLGKMDFGKQTSTVGKVGTVCQWAGYALSFLVSGVENYAEFDGDMTNARFWGETVLEGVVDVGLGIGAGIAAAALLPATWPAIAVGAVGVGVVWVGNQVCEWITGGRDIGEVVADAVCDTVDAVVDGAKQVGRAISDGAKAAWDGVCDWVGGWW